MKRLLVIVLCAAACVASAGEKRIRVACIGDSITYGYAMKNRESDCYPAQLAKLLGPRYEVGNFGDSGSGVYTHLKAFGGKGPRSWSQRGQLEKALAFKPDIVISNLGINDAEEYAKEFVPDFKTGKTSIERGKFVREYAEVLKRFRAQNGKVRIIVWTRLAPCMKGHPFKGSVLPFVMSEDLERLAKSMGMEGLDMYAPLLPLAETADYCDDGIHPESGACKVIAAETAKALAKPVGR